MLERDRRSRLLRIQALANQPPDEVDPDGEDLERIAEFLHFHPVTDADGEGESRPRSR
jgi:hypothetical protein